MVTLWLNESKIFSRSHVLINKISHVSADSRSFMKLPLFQDHAVSWKKVAAQEKGASMAYTFHRLHPTIAKFDLGCC